MKQQRTPEARTVTSGIHRRRIWRETDVGQTLVEFSLILPIMLLMLFALVDFGRGFYTWLMITNAAREGARAGATRIDGPAIDARIYGSLCDSYPSDCALDPAPLIITKTNVQGERGTTIDVELAYDFSYVTPISAFMKLLGGTGLADPTITAHASMRLE